MISRLLNRGGGGGGPDPRGPANDLTRNAEWSNFSSGVKASWTYTATTITGAT